MMQFLIACGLIVVVCILAYALDGEREWYDFDEPDEWDES